VWCFAALYLWLWLEVGWKLEVVAEQHICLEPLLRQPCTTVETLIRGWLVAHSCLAGSADAQGLLQGVFYLHS
jgi:hypothetical protein